jgi:diguanylate cyclase (GGDEF)-like protein
VEKLSRFLAGFNGTTYDNIFRMRCKDGSYKWVQSKAKAIYDSDGRITRVAGSHIDITNLKLIEQRLEWLAYYDNLTELPNRIAFEKKMNETIIDSEIDKFALVYLDIDDFKNINDALGHVAGDYFLKYVANSLKHQIDDQDFIARLSGDEFAILYYNVDKKEDVEIKLNHLLEVTKKPWEYMDRKLYFSFSAGATMYPDDGQDSLLLLKNSDIAMYAAKKNQSIRYNFYSEEMNETNLRRIEMIHELKNAIDQRDFELYYQPINQLNNESIYGVEALIRWNHPEKGMISPMEFIPLAEETGLICEIDYWVLETAFIQKRKWEQECSLPIKMSINISGKSLVKVSLLDKLSELIDRVDIKREDIQIEITETSYMENVEASAIILERIKEMGIKIALDDFGTGYSSLTYLEILPIDIVKLDRKFIMNPLEHAEECVIVQNLIKLTHDLNLKILAEGIETREQLNFLRENGCDLGQGYLFSRPLPASTIEEYMYAKELNI